MNKVKIPQHVVQRAVEVLTAGLYVLVGDEFRLVGENLDKKLRAGVVLAQCLAVDEPIHLIQVGYATREVRVVAVQRLVSAANLIDLDLVDITQVYTDFGRVRIETLYCHPNAISPCAPGAHIPVRPVLTGNRLDFVCNTCGAEGQMPFDPALVTFKE